MVKYFNKNIIYQILFGFVPVIIVSAVLLRSNLNIFNVHMISQTLNDEPFYAKQIENILYHGYSTGYFGYNESHALIGGLGAWSPLIIYFYSLFYKVFYFGMDTLYYINLIMIVLSLMFVYVYCNCSVKECLTYSIVFLSPLIIRYSFSGMSEPLLYSAMILLFGFYKKQNKYLGIATIFFVSIIRPYFILFYPIFLFNKNKILKSIFNIGFISIINLISYFLITYYFTAPYFFPLLRINEILSFFRFDLINATNYLVNFIINNFNAFISTITSGLIYAEINSVGFIQYIIVFSIFLLNLWKKSTIKDFNYIYMMIILFVMLLVSINIYYVVASVRHLVVMLIFPILYLLDIFLKNNSFKNIYVVLFITLFLSIFFFNINQNLWKTLDFSNYLIKDDIFEKYNSDKTGYENTVSFEYDTDYYLYHVMFSIPSSYAINFCTTDYLLNNEIRSKYVIVSVNSPTISKMEDNLYLIYKNDKLIVYKR